LVYLTADSDTVLSDLREDEVYIVGGIVDHNRLKGITLNKAQEQGIRTARLPIQEHVHIQTRKVITVNQVVELLLEYISTKNWENALQIILPKRKKVKVKQGEDQIIEEEKEGKETERTEEINKQAIQKLEEKVD